MMKTGLNRPLIREIFDKPDECVGRLSELLFKLATDESEASSPIKMTHQENNEELVFLSRNWKRTMSSRMVIDRINDMKMKFVQQS